MKNIPYLLILTLLFFSCKNYEIVYSSETPDQSDNQIIESLLGEDKNLLTFVNEFDDEAAVYSDDSLIFSKHIKTNPVLGNSRGVEFPRTANYLTIKISGAKKIKIKNNDEYRLIYVFKEKDKFKIQYSNKVIRFY